MREKSNRAAQSYLSSVHFVPFCGQSDLYKLFMNPLRPFYAAGRKLGS